MSKLTPAQAFSLQSVMRESSAVAQRSGVSSAASAPSSTAALPRIGGCQAQFWEHTDENPDQERSISWKLERYMITTYLLYSCFHVRSILQKMVPLHFHSVVGSKDQLM